MPQWQSFRQQVAQGPVPWLQEPRYQVQSAVHAAHAFVLGGQDDARLGHMLCLAESP